VSAHSGRDRCSGCQHADRAQLDADLAAGISLRVLADRYGLSRAAVHRHKSHVSVSLSRVEAPRVITSNGNASMASSADVLVAARRLYDVCSEALEAAAAGGNLLQLALASREMRGALEVLAKQIERLEQRRSVVVIDVATLPAAIEMRVAMMKALADFPEARLAVAEAMAKLE